VNYAHYEVMPHSMDIIPSPQITSVGPGADPGVQAVSPQVNISHPPGGRLPLLSARPAVTFPAV